MTQLLIPTPDILIDEIPVFCRIHPLQRPRVTHNRRQIYQPKENQQELLSELAHHTPKQPWGAPVHLELLINIQRTEANAAWATPTSKEWGDLDNQLKAVADALVATKHLTDDRIIISVHASRLFAPHDITIIRLYTIESQPESSTWVSTTAPTRSPPQRPAPSPLPRRIRR